MIIYSQREGEPSQRKEGNPMKYIATVFNHHNGKIEKIVVDKGGINLLILKDYDILDLDPIEEE